MSRCRSERADEPKSTIAAGYTQQALLLTVITRSSLFGMSAVFAFTRTNPRNVSDTELI